MSEIGLAASMLNVQLILLSAILFVIGLLLADTVLEREIRWLIAYPLWMYSRLESLLSRFSSWWLLFLFILTFNAVNLFLGFVSGFLVFLPILLAVWTGLNVGIVTRKSAPTGGFWLLFLNPVAVFELPASWISFSLGIELGMTFLQKRDFSVLGPLFHDRLTVFFWLVIPLLVIAALIESALLHYLRTHTGGNDGGEE